MAKRVSSEDFEAEVLGSDLPVVVEFYSDSCIPCKQLSPILGGLEDDYEDQVKVVKVNVNFDAGLAQNLPGVYDDLFSKYSPGTLLSFWILVGFGTLGLPQTAVRSM